jgi:hypothetical protein
VSRIFGGHGDAVIDALASTCELVEDYPDDPRGHSCLVLTFEAGARLYMSFWELQTQVILSSSRFTSPIQNNGLIGE